VQRRREGEKGMEGEREGGRKGGRQRGREEGREEEDCTGVRIIDYYIYSAVVIPNISIEEKRFTVF
jgi:hypothetical protein